MVGTGLGAKHGILIKDGEALELCAKATDAVFDKTGTLTQGAPKVVAVLTAPASTGAAEAVDAEKGAAAAGIAEKDGEEAGIAEKDGGEAPAAAGADGAAGTAAPFTQAQILEAAAALERASAHPLARAVMAEVEDVTALPQVEGFDSVAGKGVVGHVEGVRWAVGNARLLEELHVALPAWAKAAAAPGVTSMFVAAGECCVARIDVRDTLKPGTRKALLGLKEQGITTWLLSGDAQTSSEAIAQEAGIEPAHVIAQVLPQDKAAHVAALKAEGRVVVMVGDGVNDTPALATADIGMAMGGATDAALEVGSVVLMRDDIASVGRAVKLARATLKKIHQNFFWALAYNCCLVPLAALGILAPEVSGACMALSSVSVVTSSLLLYRLRLD
jgi:Cu+-exporting ATPase